MRIRSHPVVSCETSLLRETIQAAHMRLSEVVASSLSFTSEVRTSTPEHQNETNIFAEQLSASPLVCDEVVDTGLLSMVPIQTGV